MTTLWIFEKETLVAMLADATKVANAPVNSAQTRKEAQEVVDSIREELSTRRWS